MNARTVLLLSVSGVVNRMFIETNVDFVRGIASWKPITDKGGKSLPALGMVSFTFTDDSLTVAVTDKYRLVYAVMSGDFRESSGRTDVVPMSLFVSFVNATKQANGGQVVEFVFGGVSVAVTGCGVSMTEELYRGAYPNLSVVFDSWQPATDSGEVFFDMGLVSDVVKIGNPFEKQVTVGKRNNSWRMVRGEVSRAVRFDRGEPDKFAVLVQPKKSLGV